MLSSFHQFISCKKAIYNLGNQKKLPISRCGASASLLQLATQGKPKIHVDYHPKGEGRMIKHAR
jgi:hypothetical protein